jgi:hypothetical protein
MLDVAIRGRTPVAQLPSDSSCWGRGSGPARFGRRLCCIRDADNWRIQRGHGLFTDTGMDCLRTRIGSWTVRGCGLDEDGHGSDTVGARTWTVFGLDTVADWTRPRTAGRAMARTFRVQTATISRTQKP